MSDLETYLQLQEINAKLAQVRESCRNRNLQKVALSENIEALKLVEQSIQKICPGINPFPSFNNNEGEKLA